MNTEDKTSEENGAGAKCCDTACCTPEAISAMMSKCCGSTARGETRDRSEIMAKCCGSVSEAADCCPTTGKEE